MNRKPLAVTGVFTLAAGALVAVGIAIGGQPAVEPPDTRPAGQLIDDTGPSTTSAPEQTVPAPAGNTPAEQQPEVVVPPAAPSDNGDVNQPPPAMPADQAPNTAPNNPAPVEQPAAPAPVEQPLPPGPRPAPTTPEPGKETSTSDVG